MQHPDTHDAPIVPTAPDTPSEFVSADGGSRPGTARPFDRPPATDHATDYSRCSEEIEPLVPDVR